MAAKKREAKLWYYGTREGKWYLAKPSTVPLYKRGEGITQLRMKIIGRAKAKKIALAPNVLR